MPNVTLYIRKEDMELWAAVPNKAELVSRALRGAPYGEPKRIDKSKEIKMPLSKISEPRVKPEVIKTPEQAKEAVSQVMSPQSVMLCKIHGTPLDSRGKCLQKGCKFG